MKNYEERKKYIRKLQTYRLLFNFSDHTFFFFMAAALTTFLAGAFFATTLPKYESDYRFETRGEYTCRWDAKHITPADKDDRYEIVCKIGEWNDKKD